jgi:DNA-binding LacI/PurR family transcriptional regulator
MRERVLAAVAELGYRPSRVARTLRARRANIIGLIVSDIQNPFFTAIARGVEDIAYERQYGVFLCNSDEDPQKEALYVELMLAEQVAGVIVSPTVEGAPHYASLLEAGIPVTAIDRRLGGPAVADVCIDTVRIDTVRIDTVRIDNVAAAYTLVAGLIQQGHRRIGAILGPALATTGWERRQGYEDALRDHGIVPDERLMHTGIPKQRFGYLAARALLTQADAPTAIFAGNNLITVGLLQALHELGLRPGHEVAIAAFDELDWMNVIDIPLLVAAQPTYAMGRHAAELLFARAENRDRPSQELILSAEIHDSRFQPETVPA